MMAEAISLARSASNPAVEFDVLGTHLQALDDPNGVDEVIAGAQPLLALAERERQPIYAWEALWRRRLAWLGLGQRREADRDLEQLRHLARRVGHPVLKSALRNLETGQALADGRFDEAERLLAVRDATCERVHYPLHRMTRALLLNTLMRARGRVNPAYVDYDDFIEQYEYLGPVIRAGVACALLDGDQAREARQHYELIKRPGLATLARDAYYLPLLAYLAVLCHAFGDTSGAAELRASLAPFAARHVVNPFGLPIGSVARYLALLEQTLGDNAAAERRLRQAVNANEASKLSMYAVLARHELGRLLMASGDTSARLRGATEIEEAERQAAGIGLHLADDISPWVIAEPSTLHSS